MLVNRTVSKMRIELARGYVEITLQKGNQWDLNKTNTRFTQTALKISLSR